MKLHSVVWLLLLLLITARSEQPTNDADSPDSFDDAAPDDTDELVMKQVDMYAFLTVCPVCFLCIFVITLLYILYPETRKMPNDIMLALSISDMLLLGQWFSCSLYYLINDGHKSNLSGNNFTIFCSVEAFFGIIGSGGQFIYNCIFCLFLIIQIRVGIKNGGSAKFRAIVYHGIAIGLLVVVSLAAYATNSQGLNTYGTCSFKESDIFAYASIAFVILYLALACYTLYCFKKQIPDDPAFRKYRDTFLKYYTQYVKWTVVIWSVLSVSRVVVTVNMQLHTPVDTLFIFVTIDNIAKLAAPVVLAIIRYRNPSIKPIIDRFFRKKVCCCFYQRKSIDEADMEKAMLEDDSSALSELELNWFGQLTSSLQLSQLYTIVLGLNKNIRGRIFRRDDSGLSQTSLPDPTVETKHETITARDMTSTYSSKTTIIPMRMTVYCPTLFEEFLSMDQFTLENLRDSLDPAQSLSLINQSISDGGKSGEFFLFTHDHRILLKTITEEEIKVYLARIGKFSDHYRQHPDSLITKFYGLFSFECTEFDAPKIHLLLTKNITQVGRNQLAAIYDLKGSRHNREVLKLRRTLSFKVLKDIDFENIEGRVRASPKELRQLKEALIADSVFFKEIELIDYSLIISKVDLEEQPAVQVGQCQSLQEPEIYYRIGIVDYLQLWTNMKKLEKTAKRLINASPQLDTSAQDPVTYSKRFIQLLQRIFAE